jgi:hypothetical protein
MRYLHEVTRGRMLVRRSWTLWASLLLRSTVGDSVVLCILGGEEGRVLGVEEKK